MKKEIWVIEYSFYYEAYGVLQLFEYVKKAQDNYAQKKLYPYVILGIYESENECRSECAAFQKHRNKKPLSIEHRLNEFQNAVECLKQQAEINKKIEA